MIWPAISCQLLHLLPFPSAATPRAHSRKDLFTALRCSGKSLYETSPPTPRVTRAPLSPLVWSRDTSWAALSYMSLYVGHAPAITHILKGRQRKIAERERGTDGRLVSGPRIMTLWWEFLGSLIWCDDSEWLNRPGDLWTRAQRTHITILNRIQTVVYCSKAHNCLNDFKIIHSAVCQSSSVIKRFGVNNRNDDF